MGWGKDRHLLADLYDAVVFNTRMTGNWTEPPDIPSYPRPQDAASESKPKLKQGIKDLWTMLNRGGSKK